MPNCKYEIILLQSTQIVFQQKKVSLKLYRVSEEVMVVGETVFINFKMRVVCAVCYIKSPPAWPAASPIKSAFQQTPTNLVSGQRILTTFLWEI